MTHEIMVALVHAATVVLQTSDDSKPVWLLLAGPVGGVGTYWAFYRYYRNTDKSHDYEHETLVNAEPITGGEEPVRHISRTQSTHIDGDNRDHTRQRVQRIR